MTIGSLGEDGDVAGPELPDADLLRAALTHLSHDHRTALALHHLEGRPVAEIAVVLGIPIGTAKSRLFNARAALEKALHEEAQR
jgi:RNA polymerase sigma-70 factor (ECF subfamily)